MLPIGGFILGFTFTVNAAVPLSHTFGDPNIWQWAPSRTYRVENYKLTLHFDEPKGEVFGDEVVTLQPFESHFRRFYLDSSDLKIDSVFLERSQDAPVKLAFILRHSHLWISLDHGYGAKTTLHVRISYNGFPRTGLFFVNPTPNYPNWPHEVYSQGEPEFNHYWFPCWDYPNDMATSETITTVPEGQSVISNGKLVKVTRSSSQITYDWVESIPHSSYLISIAAGPFRKVIDRYEDKPVDYYVPDSVDEATARRSFHLTPDMLGFFSRATGVDYPYEQYAQTTVHNYIFGGQENVSATTLTEWTLHDERADQDYPSTNLVSHELGQHWFGDFVQGRDWANIWLNEGFATYLSALYTQHHEGYDAYRFAIYNDQMAAQTQDREDYRRPIVDRHYIDPLQMFDAITHEKGAAVLDMLRYVLDGTQSASYPASQNEPLFLALHHYLAVHHAQTADTADLVEAIRTATGRELDWFFREWVFMAGHPDYRVEASYDTARKIEKLTVTQMQRVDAVTPIFDMPIELAFYGVNGERKEIKVRDNSQQQEFDVSLDFNPQWVDFDPDDFIDKTVQFDQPLDAWIAEVERDPSMMSRLWAAKQLGGKNRTNADARVASLKRILSTDAFYAVRAAAAASLGNIGTPQARAALLSALQQPDSRVRTAVVDALGNFTNDRAVYDAFVGTLHNDESYAAQAAAAEELGRSGVAQAFDVLQAKAKTKPEIYVMEATLDGLVATRDSRAAEILLTQARPGVPERIRLSALAGLPELKDAVQHDHAQELVEVVRAALHDPFLPVRETGVQLVGTFDLTQFQADIQIEAQSAPMAQDREAAKQILEQLQHSQ
ncbi:MAG TPA: M1 family aminopeptidase [Acidobacteriaceae bacterium]|jgi:aminopeptidase N|nr:M1 family aminopeptidase [Acidobacteriaceae bacterium]